MFPAEEPTPPGGDRWTLVVSCVRVKNQRSFWSGKGFNFFVGHRTTNSSGRDLFYLVTIDEAKPMMVRLHGNTIKEVNSGTCSTCSTLPNSVPDELRTGVPTSSAM